MGIASGGGDSGRPESWRKKIASRLVLVLASSLLMLLLLEAFARVFVTDPRGLFVSPQLGYAMVPHFSGKHGKFGQFKVRIETNSRGLRDREFSREGRTTANSRPGRFRQLRLGSRGRSRRFPSSSSLCRLQAPRSVHSKS